MMRAKKQKVGRVDDLEKSVPALSIRLFPLCLYVVYLASIIYYRPERLWVLLVCTSSLLLLLVPVHHN
jgi:hypothetical protein